MCAKYLLQANEFGDERIWWEYFAWQGHEVDDYTEIGRCKINQTKNSIFPQSLEQSAAKTVSKCLGTLYNTYPPAKYVFRWRKKISALSYHPCLYKYTLMNAIRCWSSTKPDVFRPNVHALTGFSSKSNTLILGSSFFSNKIFFCLN